MKIEIEWRNSGEYNKEVGMRVVKDFKKVTFILGAWKKLLRIEFK